MNNLTRLETTVMEYFVAGNDEALEILREQLKVARVIKREMTGVGFFSDFWLPSEVRRIPDNPSFKLCDVMGNVEGVKNGVGFWLWIEGGDLSDAGRIYLR